VGSGGEQDAEASDDDAEECAAPVADVNERRTRRGVYAIVQEQDSDSDESDDGEQEGNKPLANAPDALGDDEVDLELGGEASHSVAVSSSSHRSVPTEVSTPDPDIQSSRMSSVAADGSASSNKGKTFARSIISTRKQKAQESSSNHSTPVPHDTSHTQSSRLRHQSLRDSVSVTPSRSKGKETERVQVKEENEARVLRARPSVVGDKLELAGPPKREIPRGEDGKPLPTCVTCSNVLPVISVDSKVVWGLHLDSPRRGKKSKQRQECPR
jgi:histone-lysine N-methyltransferase SUV420H